MSDWLDDLYESPGSDTESILHRKKEAIDYIIAEFDVHGKSKVRLRWIIENKMNIEGYVYSSDLIEIYYTLLETGDYDGRLFKFEGMSDIMIWRKPFRERHLYLTEAGKVAIGIFIGYLISRIFHI